MCAAPRKGRRPKITSEYDDRRQYLKTGDIVLFSGKQAISAAIKWMSRSKWSHVGMVYRLEDLILLWESTMISDITDFDSNEAVRGVRLVVLSECVKQYDADIVVRHLKVDWTDKMNRALTAFRRKVRGRPYEKSKVELIKAAYDGWLGENREDLSSLFCSELIAETYQQVGLLPDVKDGGWPSNEYTPGDFASDARHPLGLLKGASLSKEHYLRRAS